MSVYWETERFGYDGDFMLGHVKVNYWRPRGLVEAEIDEQLAEIRKAMLAEYPSLVGEGS
jgi:hypothetical protein